MKDYFRLQYVMLQRKLTELGVNPAVAFVAASIALVLLTEYACTKSSFGGYLIALIGLALQINLAETGRTEFIGSIYCDRTAQNIRLIEHSLIALPFLLLLIWKAAWLPVFILVLCTNGLALTSRKFQLFQSIPTPFKQHPYEFTAGFRNTFFLFPLAYALVAIALSVDNQSLGIFSLVLVFLVCLTYYSKPEGEYYIWTYNLSSKTFLLNKLKLAARNSFILNLPILIPLLLAYSQQAWLILLVYTISLLLLITIVLAKYSAYPGEINLLQGIIIALSLQFPPLLLFTIPFFYLKSLEKLKLLLHD